MAGAWYLFLATTKNETLIIAILWPEFHIKLSGSVTIPYSFYIMKYMKGMKEKSLHALHVKNILQKAIDRSPPGKTGTQGNKEDCLSRFTGSSLLNGFMEGKGDTGSGGIPIFFNIMKYFVIGKL